jgi:hypothetical protein
MRRLLSAGLVLLSLAAFAAAAGAQVPGDVSIIDRKPMDVGKDQVGTIQNLGTDLLYPEHWTKLWFDAGVAYPTGQLHDDGLRPGLLVRFNQAFWRSEPFTMSGSFGAYFGNYSYYNDSQEDLAYQGAVNEINTKYYIAWPLMLDMNVKPKVGDSVEPFLSVGPGMVWSHEADITSAVNNGVGTASDDTLTTGPGGEQGISPYVIRTRTRFNLGWNAKAGIGFRASSGPRPLWVRGVLSSMTYYHHTAPRTWFGFYASFGR